MQQGTALLLTGRDVMEEVLIDDLAVISKDKLLNFKKVPPNCLCGVH